MPRHLHQSEARDLADLHPGAVLSNRLTDAILHLTLIALRPHIDEIDDNQAAQVAKSQLAGNLLSRFQVCVERRCFDITALGCTGRVDVDRNQRFRMVDDEAASGRQIHGMRKCRFDLRFNLIARKQWH